VSSPCRHRESDAATRPLRHDPHRHHRQAYEAITATLALGSVAYDGGHLVWLDRRAMSNLEALRQTGEDDSAAIIRLADGGA
jgi:hypothetical protein